MISVIISLLIMLAASWACSRITKRRIEECVPVVIMGTIVILYLFYIFNLLLVGRIVVYLLFAAMLVFAVIRNIRSGFDLHRILTPGIILLLGLSIVFIIYAYNLKPAVWDELRLWAAMPKALHFTEALQVGEGSLLYTTMQSYPPGMALLVYFFTAFSGTFSYGSTFAVYWIFMASLLIPATKHLKWKQWYVLPLIFFFVIVIPIVLTVNGNGPSGDWNFFFASLYIDPVLGCLMGYAFYQAIKNPMQDWFRILSFSLTLFVLPALKNMGAIYACVAFVIAVVIMPFEKSKRRIISSLVPLIAIAISYLSWQLIINTKGTGEFIDMKLTSFTATKFLNVLKGMVTWGHIPFLYYALFFILFGLFLTFVLKDISKKAYLVGAAGFLIAFLIFFYGYTSHYGLMLSSIHRYTSTFTFAAFIYLLMRLIARWDPKAEYSFRGKLIEDNYQEFEKEHAADESELREIEAEETKGADAGMTRADARAISKKVILNVLPSKPVNAGRLMFIEALIIVAAILLLFNSKTNQLKNDGINEAGKVIPQFETMVMQGQDAAVLSPAGTADVSTIGHNPETTIMIKDAGAAQYDVKHPAKCYLALGGDTRKQSQKHESYALEAIGSKLNIQNIWCDKLYNEAEDGVVTSQSEMTRIWAENLLNRGYEYVLVVDPDEDILYAINEIAPDILWMVHDNTFVLRVVPADNPYGITFIRI